MALAQFEKDEIIEVLNDRTGNKEFAYTKLFPLRSSSTQAGSIVYQEDVLTIPTLESMRVHDGDTPTPNIIDLETAISYNCKRYGRSYTIPYARINAGVDTADVAYNLDRAYMDIDYAFESNTKTLVDAASVEAASTAAATRCFITGAKWTPATYSQIIIDMNDAWEAFVAQCGKEPNWVGAHPSVSTIVSQAFNLIDEPYTIKELLAQGINEVRYERIKGALMQSMPVTYRIATSGTSQFTYMWDKRVYMGYVASMPREDTATRTFGQMMYWPSNGSEYYIGEEVNEITGDMTIAALTYKDQKVVDSDCIYKIAGPRTGSPGSYLYDLV